MTPTCWHRIVVQPIALSRAKALQEDRHDLREVSLHVYCRGDEKRQRISIRRPMRLHCTLTLGGSTGTDCSPPDDLAPPGFVPFCVRRPLDLNLFEC